MSDPGESGPTHLDITDDTQFTRDNQKSLSTACSILENSDVLEEILAHLKSVDEENGMTECTAKKDLLSAALTCRSFLNPALATLWHTMGDIMHIFKLISNITEVGGTYFLPDAPTEQSFVRFDLYVMHIRVLLFSPSLQPSVACILPLFSHVRPGPLLPALQILRVQEPIVAKYLNNCSLLYSLITPTISTIHYEIGDTAGHGLLQSSLSIMATGSRGLCNISLAGLLEKQIISLPFCHFKNLRILKISFSLRRESDLRLVLVNLSHIQSITRLALRVVASQKKQKLGSKPVIVTFPSSLQSLEVSGTTQSIMAILSRLRARALECIKIIHFTAGTLHADRIISECLEVSSSLRRILMTREVNDAQPLSESQITQGLSFLGALRLHTINIQGYHIPNARAQITECCSTQNWTDMLIMHLPFYTWQGVQDGQPQPSLDTLYLIAENCPNLISLQICVDIGSSISPALLNPNLLDRPRLYHNLKALKIASFWGVSNSRILTTTQVGLKFAVKVARSISHIFPYLDLSDGNSGFTWEAEQRGLWETVDTLLGAFQALRED